MNNQETPDGVTTSRAKNATAMRLYRAGLSQKERDKLKEIDTQKRKAARQENKKAVEKTNFFQEPAPPEFCVPTGPSPATGAAFTQAVREEFEKFRKVCLVCDRLTDPKRIQQYPFSLLPNCLLERIQTVCLRPEAKLQYLQDRLSSSTSTALQVDLTASYLKEKVHKDLIKYYNVCGFLGADSFPDCLLSRAGIEVVDDVRTVYICSECETCLRTKLESGFDMLAPPDTAIANGLWIGSKTFDHNRAERNSLCLYTVYREMYVVRRLQARPKVLTTAISLFDSGVSVARVLLPHVGIEQVSDIELIYMSNDGKLSESVKQHLDKETNIRVEVLRKDFEWLQENNVWYSGVKYMDDDALGIILKLRTDRGETYRIVKSSANIEASTPISATSEQAIGINNSASPNDDIESEGPKVASVHLPPPRGLDAEVNLLDDVQNLRDSVRELPFGKPLEGTVQSITLKSGNRRAFFNQEGVIEGAFFDLFPYGTGGFAVNRQTPLDPIRYFNSLLRLSNRSFGKHVSFIALAIEVARFHRAKDIAYHLSGKEICSLLEISTADLGKAYENTLQANSYSQRNLIPPDAQTLCNVSGRMMKQVLGTKESKIADRQDVLSLCYRYGQPTMFQTFNPSHRSSIIVYEQILRENVVEYSDEFGKKMVNEISNNFEGQVYALEKCVDTYIELNMGFDSATFTRLPEPGLFGELNAFYGTVESTGQQYLHSHWLVWCAKLPSTPQQIDEFIESKSSTEEAYMEDVIKMAENFVEFEFPVDLEEIVESMQCTKCFSACSHQEVDKQFRVIARVSSDHQPYTIRCSQADCPFKMRTRELAEQQIKAFIERLHLVDIVYTNLHEAWQKLFVKYRCDSSKFPDGCDELPEQLRSTNIEEIRREFGQLVLMLYLLDMQYHLEEHTCTCGKKGPICRTHFPKMVLVKSLFDGILKIQTPVLNEYVNHGLKYVGLAFHCNTDVQFLVSLESIGALIVYYVVKYIVKPQDNFGKRNINAILEAFVRKFVNARNYKMEQASDNVEEDSKERRKIGTALAYTLLNLLLKGQEIELPIGIFHLKNQRQYWSSHSFVSLFYSPYVKRFFLKEQLDHSRPFVRVRPASVGDEAIGSFISVDIYNMYLHRPGFYENLSFYQFMLHGHIARKHKDYKPSHKTEFQQEFAHAKDHYYLAIENIDGRSVTLKGPSFPVHFNFKKNPMTIIFPNFAQRTTGHENEMVDEENSGKNGDEQDKELNPDDNDHDDDDQDELVGDHEKEELYGFLVGLLFLPYRKDVTSLLHSESESWWQMFERKSSVLSPFNRRIIGNITELQISPEMRKSNAARQKLWEDEALAAYKKARDKAQAEGCRDMDVIPGKYNNDDEDNDQLGWLAPNDLLDEYRPANKLLQAINKSYGSGYTSVLTLPSMPTTAVSKTTSSIKEFESWGQDANGTKLDLQVVKDVLKRIKDEKITSVWKKSEVTLQLQKALSDRIQRFGLAWNLNKTQMMAFSLYATRLEHARTAIGNEAFENPYATTFPLDEPLHMMFHGAGGCGKSYLIDAITGYAESLSLGHLIVKTSEFGSTASNIMGNTLSYWYGMNRTNSFNVQRHEKELKKCIILIIDELSLCTVRSLDRLNQAFKAAKGTNTLFGGVNTIGAGDHTQLGGVGENVYNQKNNIVSDMKIWYDQISQNLILFANQKRFSACSVLNSMATSYRRGGGEFYTEIQHEFIQAQTITKSEINLDKAIVLVSTQAERGAFISGYQAAMKKANVSRKGLIGWGAHIGMKKGNLESELDDLRAAITLEMYNSKSKTVGRKLEGFSIYRPGELIVVTNNLSVQYGVANGALGTIESFVFRPAATFELVMDEDGYFEVASEPPVCVIIRLTKSNIELADFGTDLRPVFLTPQTISLKWKGEEASFSVTNIPMCPAFCITCHSIQGKTIAEMYSIIITDLRKFWKGQNPAAFYVCFTRLKQDFQTRFLSKSESIKESMTLEDLRGESFKPSKDVVKLESKFWNAFEDLMVRLEPDTVIGRRMYGEQRRRRRDYEPIGIPNLDNCSWFSSLLQLIRLLPTLPAVTELQKLQEALQPFLQRSLFDEKQSFQEAEVKFAFHEIEHSTTLDTFFPKYQALFHPLVGWTTRSNTTCESCKGDGVLQDRMTHIPYLEIFTPCNVQEALDTWLESPAEPRTLCGPCQSSFIGKEKRQILNHIILVIKENVKVEFRDTLVLCGKIYHLQFVSEKIQESARWNPNPVQDYFVSWIRTYPNSKRFNRVDGNRVETFVYFNHQLETFWNTELEQLEYRVREECDCVADANPRVLMYTLEACGTQSETITSLLVPSEDEVTIKSSSQKRNSLSQSSGLEPADTKRPKQEKTVSKKRVSEQTLSESGSKVEKIGEIQPSVPDFGLQNIGGLSCYMNSTIQLLSALPQFRQFIDNRVLNSQEGCSELQLELVKGFKEIFKLEDGSTFRPVTLYERCALPMFKGPSRQEDATELLLKWITQLDYFHEIPNLFYFPVRIKCAECHTIKVQIYSTIALNRENGPSKSLVELLGDYQEKGNESCTICQKNTVHSVAIDDGPGYLLITIDRGESTSKSFAPVTFELNELSYFKNGYLLKAFICHEGPTIASGHYYCYRKCGIKWIKFSDNIRSVLNMEEETEKTFIQKNIVGLAYERM